MGTARWQAAHQALDRSLIHRLLAGAVSRARLSEKQRPRLGGWKQPLAVLGQQRLDRFEQARASRRLKKA